MLINLNFISLFLNIEDMKFRKDIEQDLENEILPKVLTNIPIDIPKEDDIEEIDESFEIQDED